MAPTPAPPTPSPPSQQDLDLSFYKQRVAQLEKEVHDLQERAVVMFSRTEAESEGQINKLVKRLAELKKEKEMIAMEAEREEEVGRPACLCVWVGGLTAWLGLC